MKALLIGSTLLLALASVGPSRGWTLAPCGPNFAKLSQIHARVLREAKPGSSVYTPHPFPRVDAEVIADFVYQYRESWSDIGDASLPSEERELLAALKAGEVRFEITRVENWSHMRCTKYGERPFSYLIRMINQQGVEMARGSVGNDGLFRSMFHVSNPTEGGEEQRIALLSIDHLRGVAAGLGLGFEDPQYLETLDELYCTDLVPCASFRSGEATFLAKLSWNGSCEVYRVGQERFDFLGEVRRQQEARIPQDPVLRGLLVSLGGDVGTRATLVGTVPANDQ